MKITALAGGVGAARFLRGLLGVCGQENLTVIGNVGDNIRVQGLLVAPDIDIVTYALTGLWDSDKGWGIKGELRCAKEVLNRLGGTEFDWFDLGDKDLAVCLWRTYRMSNGERLSSVTSEISRRLGSRAHIIPCSDDEITTMVHTEGKWMSFEEYYVRLKSSTEIDDLKYEGSQSAAPAPGVVDAINSSDIIVVCPSNPVASIGPILSVKEIRAALVSNRSKVVAVSPLVAGKTLKGPADRMMRGLGLEASVTGVAKIYADFVSKLVIDVQDSSESEKVESTGVKPVVANTIMVDEHASRLLASKVIAL
ncbi:MAG: 2-phospho-L-lactate transferase [Thermoprotei archaeon]